MNTTEANASSEKNNLRSSFTDIFGTSSTAKVSRRFDSKKNQFYYSVGTYNILLEQDTKVENLTDIKINKIPHTPEWCSGITNVRGVIMPVVNMRRFLNIKEETNSHMIMLEHHQYKPIIFLIDHLPNSIQTDDCVIDEATAEMPKWVLKTLKNGSDTIYEVDHSKILDELRHQ